MVEIFEDSKGVIRSHQSKTDRHYNDQNRIKRQNNTQQSKDLSNMNPTDASER